MIRFSKFFRALFAFTLLISSTISCSYLELKKDNAKKFNVRKKWVRNTLNKEYLGFRHLHRMSPIVTDNYIIQGNAVDGIVAYKRKTAHKLWQFPIKGGVEGGAALVDDQLFFGASDGYFYSLNAKNGQVIWSFPIHSEGLSQPLVHSGKVYFLSGNNVAYALNKTNGQKIWIYNRRDPSHLSIRGGSTPQIYKNKIYFAFSDGYLVSLNKDSGQLSWEKQVNANKKFRDVDAPPLILDDKLYIAGFDDSLFCLRASSGQLIWKHEAGGYSAPLIFENKLFYSTTQNELHVLEKSSGKLLDRIKSNNGYITQPKTYKGLLIYGESEGDLVIRDINKTSLIIGKFSPGHGISSSPIIKSFNDSYGNVFFVSRNANLYVLDIDWKSATETWPWDKK